MKKNILMFCFALINLVLINCSYASDGSDHSSLYAKMCVHGKQEIGFPGIKDSFLSDDDCSSLPYELNSGGATLEYHIQPVVMNSNQSICDVRVIFDDNDFTGYTDYTYDDGSFEITDKDSEGRVTGVRMTHHNSNFITVSSNVNGYSCYLTTYDADLNVYAKDMHSSAAEGGRNFDINLTVSVQED